MSEVARQNRTLDDVIAATVSARMPSAFWVGRTVLRCRLRTGRTPYGAQHHGSDQSLGFRIFLLPRGWHDPHDQRRDHPVANGGSNQLLSVSGTAQYLAFPGARSVTTFGDTTSKRPKSAAHSGSGSAISMAIAIRTSSIRASNPTSRTSRPRPTRSPGWRSRLSGNAQAADRSSHALAALQAMLEAASDGARTDEIEGVEVRNSARADG